MRSFPFFIFRSPPCGLFCIFHAPAASPLDSIEDYVYPCLKVSFGEPINYINKYVYSDEGINTIQYNISFPSKPYYSVAVVKRNVTNESVGWDLAPVSQQYADTVKVYVIEPDEYSEKSAAVVLIDKDGAVYLRSVVGENITSQNAYLVVIDRLVASSHRRNAFIPDVWRQTNAGKRYIKDMITFTEKIYENTEITDCRYLINLDKGVNR